ncbi:MAG TPA: methyltransferase domain-containing protein [Candidatus Binatia bacterium]|nr:methyltransferase domain-containing protein [Candidatus Binatia bacterium]
MNWVERIHSNHIVGRRARVLSRYLAQVIPEAATLLDVGCGDGLIDSLIRDLRPDLELQGIDVLVRSKAFIPVTPFDGRTLPYANSSFDCVMFVDVLHHALDPIALLGEAVRACRQSIVIKDHALEGFLANSTLRMMDEIGNRRYGVALPFNYWTTEQWLAAWNRLGLEVKTQMTKLGLYPWPLSLIFDRSLHFVARLDRIPFSQRL